MNSAIKSGKTHSAQGFSLLEIMVVLVIVAIMSAFSIPLYERYVMRSAVERAKAELIDNQRRLEMFKQKNVTYAGFNFTDYYTAGFRTSRTVNVPLTKNGSLRDYQINVGNSSAGGDLSTTAATSAPGWRMVAIPNRSRKSLKLAPYLLMDSNGLRCQTTTVLGISSVSCGTNSTTW